MNTLRLVISRCFRKCKWIKKM